MQAALAWPSTGPANRRITLDDYRDKVYGASIGQIAGASYGFNFEGKARNVIQLDHFLNKYDAAVVDDDYYYEMVALYGFERFGPAMTVEQLGDMWKEYRAGTWGSSEQARLALERGIKAPETGSPRYNRWFHTIGPQFSSDIYGMISPGMVNLAGAVARKYSHVNGYAEGSDGAVFVAACISEAFFETNPAKIVYQAAQLIDPRSNYRKAIDFVLAGYEQRKPWRQIAAGSEARWRPDYPQMNNSVANGALVALGILYGDGDFLRSAKGTDARRQTGKELVSPLGGTLDTGPVLREFLRASMSSPKLATIPMPTATPQTVPPSSARCTASKPFQNSSSIRCTTAFTEITWARSSSAGRLTSASTIWLAVWPMQDKRTCSPTARGSKAAFSLFRGSSPARSLSNISTSTITENSGTRIGASRELLAEALI